MENWTDSLDSIARLTLQLSTAQEHGRDQIKVQKMQLSSTLNFPCEETHTGSICCRVFYLQCCANEHKLKPVPGCNLA